jgi:hypothetical protein
VTYAILALMGEGKSYTMVHFILGLFEQGKPCATNISLIPEAVDAYFGNPDPPYPWRDLYRFLRIGEILIDERGVESFHPDNDPWLWPEGDKRSVVGGARVAIIIDEAGEWLDPDLPGGKGRLARILARMRHSDKWGQDWYLIIQDMSHFHRRAKKLIQYYWVIRNMAKARIPFCGFPYPPPQRFNFEKWVYQRDAKTLVYRRPEWIPRDQKVFNCYKTEVIFGEAAKYKRGERMGNLGRKIEITYSAWIAYIALFCTVAAAISVLL